MFIKNSENKTVSNRVKHLVAFGALIACCSVVIVSVVSDTVKSEYESMDLQQVDIIADNESGSDAALKKANENKTAKEKTNKNKLSVYVTAGGKKKKYSADKGTVGAFLKEKGINYDSDDIINCPPETALKNNMEIRIRRVEYKITFKIKKIAFKSETKESADYYEGESYIERQGIKGENKELYLTKYIDGVVKNEIYLSKKRVKDPVNEIIGYGTKKRMIEKGSIGQTGFSSKTAISQIPATVEIILDQNGRPENYKKKIVGPATAYCGGGTTSTGRAAMPGRVAVDPKEIPYGSKLYIVSSDGKYIYGYCEACDTGGFIHTSSTVVDLYFSSYSDCVNFGRRSVEIYVIE